MNEEQLPIPFDQYGRYRDLREAADFLKGRDQTADFSLLDIGGFFLPISGDPYLPARLFFPHASVTAIDMTSPGRPVAHFIRADGTQLPFPDASFTWVNASDVLEHVPVSKRPLMLQDMLRCSKGIVSLSIPAGGAGVDLAEEFVLSYLRRIMKIEHEALSEHRAMSVPTADDIGKLVRSCDSSLKLAIIPSGNLYRWIFMMISRHLAISLSPGEGLNPQIDRLYNLHCYASDHQRPTYRNLYVIGTDPAIDNLEQHFQECFSTDSDGGLQNDALLMDLLSRIEDQERWLHLKELQERQITLVRELAEAREQAAYFHRELNALSEIWPVKLWRRMKKLT